ncbi:MAG: glycosyltransferase family 4 protein [Sedimentisphaerales bacterium]|nr:glycosyltransferase family 4 protein [Sedimentisphaerales bacterium]
MINAYANYFGNLGYNIHSRNFFNALDTLEDLCLVSFNNPETRDEFTPQAVKMLKRGASIDFNNLAVCLEYGNLMQKFCGKKRIGYTVWESTLVPKDWINQLKQLDQVWVPSSWGRDVFVENGISEDFIRVVPEGVDTSVFNPDITKFDELDNGKFKFLVVGKYEERKCTKEIILSFSQEFKRQEPVELVLLCHNHFIKNFDILKEIEKLNVAHPANIRIVKYLPGLNDVARLYKSCDAFLMPSRAEGWGLPIMEAMACGLPVITTNYSGQTEFVNENNAYLTEIKELVDIKDPVFFDPRIYHGQWAEPDFEHFKNLMRYVYEHRDEAKKKGQFAAEDMKQNWEWSNSAFIAYKHIRALREDK